MKYMELPLVSICIPTYNRSIYLEKTLAAITCQKPFLDKRVEVVVSDNASTDDTFALMSKLEKEYEQLHYHRNEENIRDENFPLVLSLAKGRLRCLCNDTLVYKAGHLEDLCQLVTRFSEEKPVLFFANGNLKKLEKGEKQHADMDSAMQDISYWLTWLGGFSIWAEDCEEIEKDTRNCELLLWQVGKTLALMKAKQRIIVSNKPFGRIQPIPNKDLSYGIYKVFYENFFALLMPYVKENMLGLTTLGKIKKDLLYDFFVNHMVAWEYAEKRKAYGREALTDRILALYKGESYYKSFLRYYRIKKYMYPFKEYIKKLLEGIR